MGDSEFCWINQDLPCQCDGQDCENCSELVKAFAKPVFCKHQDCPHFKEIPFKKYVNYNKDYKPFENDNYPGICTRPEIGVGTYNLSTRDASYHFPICKCHSQNFISGHMDMMSNRFLKQEGHTSIPDPIHQI